MWKDGNLPTNIPFDKTLPPIASFSIYIYNINNVLAGFIRIFGVGGGKQVDVGWRSGCCMACPTLLFFFSFQHAIEHQPLLVVLHNRISFCLIEVSLDA